MDVSITTGDADDLRALRAWLTDEDALRGRITAREAPAKPEKLGPVLEALVVAVGPGGAAVALVTGIVAWLRQQRGDLTLRVERPDGSSFEIAAQRVKGLDMPALRAEIERLTDQIDPP